MIASGGWMPRPRERVLGGRGRLDVVAGAAQGRLQRAQDLRLVVDDQDALAAHAAHPARLLDGGQRERERRALPGPRLGPDAPAVRLGEAARDREPEARAATAVRAARWNGSKMRSRSSSRDAGPVVDDAHDRLLARVAFTRTCTASLGGENLSAFSSRFTSTRWI